MIELVAITRATAPPPPDRLRALRAGTLAAVVGPVDDAEEVTAETLWRHEQAVEQLMADRDVLPVRYGTRFKRDEEAAQAVAARRATLTAALDHVRGAVELSVRAASPEPIVSAAARDRARRSIHDALRALARDATERLARPPSELLRAAYLVDRDAVDDFVAHVTQLQAARPDLRILCTGPWPPYSFSEA